MPVVVALARQVAKLMLGLFLALASPAALGASVELRDDLKQLSSNQLTKPASAVGASTPRNVTWLALTKRERLNQLPANWELTVDQTRFSAITIIIVTNDGKAMRVVRQATDLADHIALGGRLRFTVLPPGAQIRDLYIGIADIDALSLMRSVQASRPAEYAKSQQSWLLLMGVFAGCLLSAFVYNLFLFVRQRQRFQIWYLAWVTAALAYGLTWTNLIGLFEPAIAGPVVIRLNYILVGLTVGLSGLFLLSILEPHMLSRRLERGIWAAAAACFGLGFVAANEQVLTAQLTDRAFNVAMLAAVSLSICVIISAWRRGSRVVRIYLLGWSPVILVFAARSARNFGLLPQNDLVDMATWGAIAVESLVFSLAIASRFADLRKQRDQADERVRAAALEAKTLRRAAEADFLTGLGNRAAFQRRLHVLVSAGDKFTLYFIDVDYLKELNDREGHHAGDAILRYLGERLSELHDEKTCVARIGGDEFAIIAEGPAANQQRVVAFLDELQGCSWSKNNCSGTLSLSIGSTTNEGVSTTSDVLRHADLALYDAKHRGRGRHQVFDADLRARTLHKAQLILDAHAGLQRGEFLLHFQPIVDLQTSEIVSLEALLRWQHPQHGLLTPYAFAELLEDDSIGPAIQQRVISLGVEELANRNAQVLALNFTAMDLRGEAAARRLLARLKSAGVSPTSLCIEVTEGILLERAAMEPITALRTLHQAGVKIALDDFGTGYASLVHLKMVPVDTLKIDRTFVAGLLEGGENDEIVRAIIALGHGLNKTIVAEGIETVPQLMRLRELGCDYGQGYLFGRPRLNAVHPHGVRPAVQAA